MSTDPTFRSERTDDTDLARAFDRDGFVVLEGLLDDSEVRTYREIYDRFLSGEIDAGDKRADLGAGAGRSGATENITQIMWPSDLYPEIASLPLHGRAQAIARQLIGEDAELDFDMLIAKAPSTATPTPWHQDAGYWVDLPDERAASIWVSLDEATVDNGCMWYVRGSHLGAIRPHRPAGGGGGAIECDCSEDEPGATPVPLPPGSAVVHAGRTLHYSRGNTTDGPRRAYILSFRPAAMIARERELAMDHGLTENVRTVRNSLAD
ncbi:phytanoyl-CoA dioxygenase family protein [Nonomuraea angiospora]|uniref:phytanoyl-CoA dioxygenase family protein n=1 Tax=Nonomuraea angiospora TaxID=46172 RepID=UPI0029B37E0C|nr:phytanoyl-CoA dioxygenase family protein [Nonomuraea angiospora]MDX3104496.1 phytanoyl-CoA dioxygenase family protein [Nonomuraea angiospora]